MKCGHCEKREAVNFALFEDVGLCGWCVRAFRRDAARNMAKLSRGVPKTMTKAALAARRKSGFKKGNKAAAKKSNNGGQIPPRKTKKQQESASHIRRRTMAVIDEQTKQLRQAESAAEQLKASIEAMWDTIRLCESVMSSNKSSTGPEARR